MFKGFTSKKEAEDFLGPDPSLQPTRGSQPVLTCSAAFASPSEEEKYVHNDTFDWALHNAFAKASVKRNKSEDGVELSASQNRAVEAALAGRNLLVTGPAGVGKSFVMDRVVNALKLQGKRVAVTASTGIAAVLIGGTTVHSWAGIELGEGTVNEVVNRVIGKKDARKRWMQHDALVLDEVSMIDGALLDKLDAVGRAVRGTPKQRHPEPFGGIQMIFVGDFYQLPPVAKEYTHVFAFESAVWRAANTQIVELTEVFRQSDPAHVSLLHRVRVGQVDAEVAAAIERCQRPLNTDDGVLPTMLYPCRKDVRAENLHHFDKLPSRTRTYTAVDTSSSNGGKAWFGTLDRDLQAHKHLHLKEGAQVMLLANISLKSGLCNGSRGVVVGFTGVGDYKSAITHEDRVNLMSERAHLQDLKTMLAGNRRSSGAGKGGSEPMSEGELFFAAMDPDSRQFLKDCEAAEHGLPIVRFANGEIVTVKMHKWTKTFANGRVELSRTQIPLALAWALTIHKCQGMSLDRVRMDLSHVFAEGQGYVALSRARALDGMEITGFKRSAIRASSRVAKFYESFGTSFREVAGSMHDRDWEGRVRVQRKRSRDEEETAGEAAAVAAADVDGFLQHGDAEVAADALSQAARGAAAAAAREGALDPASAVREELIRMAAAAIDAGLREWRNNRDDD